MDKNVRWPRVEGPMYIIPYMKPSKRDAPETVCTDNIMAKIEPRWRKMQAKRGGGI